MNPELQNTLAQLAQKMGTTVERLWPMLVEKQKLDSLLILISFGVLGVVSLLIVLVCVFKMIWPSRNDFFYDFPFEMPILFFGFTTIIFSAVAISAIPDYVYPEAATVQTLIKGK